MIDMTTDMNFRNKGKEALRTVLNEEKNIDILEKNIYNKLKKNKDEDITDKYYLYIYQIIGDILNEKKLKEILSDIKKNKLGWKHNSFDNISNSIAEQNEFIQNPFQVEEGVFKCKKCGSKRVYSYSVQERSCDEGMSVNAECIACKTKWKERG